eukprot:3395212-Prymnesium_polylepis.1
MRRSRRASGKESALDAFSTEVQRVPGADGLSFAVGHADVGGTAAERIMRAGEQWRLESGR